LDFRPRDRFLRLFGKRECELAALAILENGLLSLDRPFTRAQALAGRPDVGGYEDAGLTLLVEYGWLAPAGGGRVVCTQAFVERVEAAVARERAEAQR
jgi:hypothetical protein